MTIYLHGTFTTISGIRAEPWFYSATFSANKMQRNKSKLPLGFFAPRYSNLTYLNMPKSACTTIKNILYWIDNQEYLAHPLKIHSMRDALLNGRSHPEVINDRLQHSFVFTFVRHPLRRAYSCFNEKIFFSSEYSFSNVRDAIIERYGMLGMQNPTVDEHRQNFKAFLRFAKDSYEGTNHWRRDPHWCPQVMSLRRGERTRRVDFVGRVEQFERHLRAVFSAADIDPPLEIPKMNEGPSPPYPFREIFDEEILNLGKKLFFDDFTLFGYQLESAWTKSEKFV